MRSSGEQDDAGMDGSLAHAQKTSVVLASLRTAAHGLDDAEAARRLSRYGPNRLPPPAPVSALQVLRDQFRSIVVALLVTASLVSVVLGDVAEAAAIGAVLVINAALGFSTEFRARRAMQAILQLDLPHANVIRAGIPRVMDARHLVPGDIIELNTGHQVPADGRLLESSELRTNEAALTGESLPSSKAAQTVHPEDTPLADRANMVYSGTTVVSGFGRAVVTATGPFTEFGRIGELTAAVVPTRTPLERRLDALGRALAWLALGVAALVAGLGALQGAPAELMLQTGIALAVAAVPEALPAVATIALAVGMRRMAARNALVRRLPAVESLGSTTVVCTDKTRTLTSGNMSVVRVWADGRDHALHLKTTTAIEEPVLRVLEAALLASRVPTASTTRGATVATDPVDRAIIDSASRLGVDATQFVIGLERAGSIPFSSDRRFMAVFYRSNGDVIANVKGAPARVLEFCRLDPAARPLLIEANNSLAQQGLRVLGVASGPVGDVTEGALRDLVFRGFIGLADPPAEGVHDTIARLQRAGLRTVMVTGDQRLTAEAVGRQLGLLQGDVRVVEGKELQRLSHEDMKTAVVHAGVFSRITPELKLRVVEALQERGEIVAMLGDGVNDAPALKRADVGVAMGTRGTDVAKQAAAIVLRDDRFETIAAAVEEGRVVFDNIRKFVFYLFSCNVAEVLVLLAAGVAALPAPLLPLQLLWLNMITDTFPALALAMEPSDEDVMERPPRNPQEAILSKSFLLRIFLYAGLITAAGFGAFLWALRNSPAHATTVAFMTLALAQIAHLGNARSSRPVLAPRRITANRYALGAVLLSAVLQVGVPYVEWLARLLRVAQLGLEEWLVVGGFAAAPAVVGQLLKLRQLRPV